MTIRRLMLEVSYMAALLVPTCLAARLPAWHPGAGPLGLLALGWAGLLILIRWAYRDFRNPFG